MQQQTTDRLTGAVEITPNGRVFRLKSSEPFTPEARAAQQRWYRDHQARLAMAEAVGPARRSWE